jgi:hypothetical protein
MRINARSPERRLLTAKLPGTPFPDSEPGRSQGWRQSVNLSAVEAVYRNDWRAVLRHVFGSLTSMG